MAGKRGKGLSATVAANDGLVTIHVPTGAHAWLLATTAAMVNDPAAVDVQARVSTTTVVLSLTVAPGDVGKIVGKGGRNARALRTILSAIGMKAGMRYELDLAEVGRPEGSLQP